MGECALPKFLQKLMQDQKQKIHDLTDRYYINLRVVLQFSVIECEIIYIVFNVY